MNLTPEVVARFRSKVDKNGPVPAHRPELGPCWVWKARIDRRGYGHFWLSERPKQAHRIAWEIANGPIADGQCLKHRCSNFSCVRPEHLRLAKDNSGDRPLFTPAFITKFWSLVNMHGPAPIHRPELGPCWIWTGGKRGAYGRIGIDGKVVAAHRISYQLQHGKIPPGFFVLHDCDVPLCQRHLKLGTSKDNTQDMIERSRGTLYSGDKHRSKTHPETVLRGESHGSSILTETNVREVRRLCSAGESQRAVATKFGVTQSCVWRIVKGKSWKHIPLITATAKA